MKNKKRVFVKYNKDKTKEFYVKVYSTGSRKSFICYERYTKSKDKWQKYSVRGRSLQLEPMYIDWNEWAKIETVKPDRRLLTYDLPDVLKSALGQAYRESEILQELVRDEEDNYQHIRSIQKQNKGEN